MVKQETQTTEGSETGAPTTAAPSTGAPTTAAPSTTAPTTSAPTTAAPTTAAPTTVAPTTAAPTTAAPTTPAPTTAAPTTAAPTTVAPTTVAPTTVAPTTAAPTTAAPTTAAPTTATTEEETTTVMSYPALEIKTGSEIYDGCDCQLTAQLISPTGSCKTNVLSESFERDSVERISGSVLGSCNAFNPENLTAVTITHKSAQEDGWKGVLMKIILTEDKVFSCPLGKWIKESDNILSETFPCKLEGTRPGVDKVKPKGWFRYSLQID